MGKLAMVMKYRLPVKVNIVKHPVRGMIAREQIACMGNPRYGVQSLPIGFEAVAKAWRWLDYAVNNPTLVDVDYVTHSTILVRRSFNLLLI
ncbi:MAG: hypothetical protein H7Y39_01625 [Nitrospiraceae bacterium]|nr:hypothetical protein [Nitrospiraceae bacterium]